MRVLIHKLVIGIHKENIVIHQEKQGNVNFNPNQINSCCLNYNQYIQKKIKNISCAKACFKLEEKETRSLKNKKQFYQCSGW